MLEPMQFANETSSENCTFYFIEPIKPPVLKCPPYGSQAQIRDLILGGCSSSEPSERGKKPWRRFVWPEAGAKINERIFDHSPNRIRWQCLSRFVLRLPCCAHKGLDPNSQMFGTAVRKFFSWRWYVAVVETRTRANPIWSGDLQCKSMFKGQRSNVVSTAPGGGGCRRKPSMRQCEAPGGGGVWNKVWMAPARERIQILQSISTEQSQKGRLDLGSCSFGMNNCEFCHLWCVVFFFFFNKMGAARHKQLETYFVAFCCQSCGQCDLLLLC